MAQAPEAFTLDADGHGFGVGNDADELAGGPVARLVRYDHGNRPDTWGLLVRVFLLDDAMYQMVQVVPRWLARWSLTEGWIGFAREELSLNPWLNFYAADGHAYAGSPGERPQPLDEQAPPFTPTRTSEAWPSSRPRVDP